MAAFAAADSDSLTVAAAAAGGIACEPVAAVEDQPTTVAAVAAVACIVDAADVAWSAGPSSFGLDPLTCHYCRPSSSSFHPAEQAVVAVAEQIPVAPYWGRLYFLLIIEKINQVQKLITI